MGNYNTYLSVSEALASLIPKDRIPGLLEALKDSTQNYTRGMKENGRAVDTFDEEFCRHADILNRAAGAIPRNVRDMLKDLYEDPGVLTYVYPARYATEDDGFWPGNCRDVGKIINSFASGATIDNGFHEFSRTPVLVEQIVGESIERDQSEIGAVASMVMENYRTVVVCSYNPDEVADSKIPAVVAYAGQQLGVGIAPEFSNVDVYAIVGEDNKVRAVLLYFNGANVEIAYVRGDFPGEISQAARRELENLEP